MRRMLLAAAIICCTAPVLAQAPTERTTLQFPSTIRCDDPFPRLIDAGGVTVELGRGRSVKVVDRKVLLWYGYENDADCSGPGYNQWRISFSKPVRNIRARVMYTGSAVVSGLNEAVLNPPQVPPGETNVEIAGPTTTLIVHATGIGSFFWIQVDHLSFEPGQFDPIFRFVAPETEQIRVLAHNYGSHPYPAWTAPDGTQHTFQNVDGRVEVRGYLRDVNGNPVAGRTVYFRVIDPRDTAQYVQMNGDAHSGDNVDRSPAAGTLQRSEVTSAADGSVVANLVVSSHAAGDNYQVEASLDPRVSTDRSFICGTGCTRSATFTVWKRMYIEKDRMFRRGAFITDEIRAVPGGVRVSVSDLSQFHTGDTVRFIHAPTMLSPGADFWFSEDHVVEVVPPAGGVPGHLKLQSGSLHHFYGPDRLPQLGTVSPGMLLWDAAGVVGVDDSATYYTANFGTPDPVTGLDPVRSTFAEAFIELNDVPAGELPLVPSIPSDTMLMMAFANKWFAHSVPLNVLPYRRASSNHRHFIVASSAAHPRQNDIGLASVAMGSNVSYTFAGTIEAQRLNVHSPLRGLPLGGLLMENAAHELAHQWRVNQNPVPAGGNTGHCAYHAWSRNGTYCRMHAPWNTSNPLTLLDPHNRERADGLIEFHYERVNGRIDSEYFTIRYASEPLTNN